MAEEDTPVSAPDAAVPSESEPVSAAAGDGGTDGGTDVAIDQAAIDELLKQANFDDPATATATMDPAADASDFKLPDFNQVMQEAQVSSIDLLRDADLHVMSRRGRS